LIFATQIAGGLDHRLALVLYLLLLLAAAWPVATAWLRLLPAEREPFAAADEPSQKEERDAFAIFLLANITLSLLLRIPGLSIEKLSAPLTKLLSTEWSNHVVMISSIWCGFIPGLAAAYALIRPNPLRWPLAIAGALTLSLWLASPFLIAAVRGSELKKPGLLVLAEVFSGEGFGRYDRGVYAPAAFTFCSAAATSSTSGTTGMS
jgi:hypothetical protein